MRSLTIERTSFFILIALLFALAFRPLADTDMWWHLAGGDYILNHGIMYSDTFSHTNEGLPWINYSWGAELIMISFWRLGGIFGLALYTALLATGGMLLLYKISAGNTYLRAFILILGSATSAIFWSARPQMFSFFFSCLLLFIVYRYKREGKDWLWAIVPMMWFWGNVHAGWSIGYLFLFAFIVGEAANNLLDTSSISWQAWRKLVLVTLISLPFLLISPYFIDNLFVPWNTVNIQALQRFIQEWQSPNFQGRETWPFIAMLLLLLSSFWASHLKFDWSSVFLLSGTLFLALLYSRNISVFAVVATPILSHHLDNTLTERGFVLRPRQRIPTLMSYLNAGIIVLVFVGVLAYILSISLPANVEKAQAKILPLGAVSYLRENALPREIFNSYNWGGYLMFALPDYPVFIDGRTDVYGDFVLEYASINFAQGDWQSKLDNYGVNFVLIEKASPLDFALAEETNWMLVYADELAVIWQRNNNE
jgi:hypothetical protein